MGPVSQKPPPRYVRADLPRLTAGFRAWSSTSSEWVCSDALGVGGAPNLPLPFSVKPLHVAAATREQSVSRAQAPSQGLEQSGGELPSLMVDAAHHDISAPGFKFRTRLRATGGVQG